MSIAGRVEGLWRYPVKSMYAAVLGEGMIRAGDDVVLFPS